MYSKILKKLLSLLTAFAMVFSMIAVVQPMKADAATETIAIDNGGFENGAFGGAMSGSNGASIVEKATYEGNYALKFDATGEILTVTAYLSEATTAEESITLSFWAKALSGSTGNSVNYGVFWYSVSDAGTWTKLGQKYGAGYPAVGGDWKQITQAVTASAGTEIVQAQIYLGSESTTAIIDNVSITDGSGSELLQSGGFEKGALNGDFNANDALEIVHTPVHSGSYTAHADKSSGNGNITATVSLEPSAEERTLSFSYWMYAPTSVNSAHNMVVCFDTSSGSWTNLSTKYGVQYATPGSWVQKTMEVAVAANTNTLQIQLYAQDTGADFYIDDLALTETVPDVVVNHDITMGLNVVTDDGTWQMCVTGDSEIPTGYYKVSAAVDGAVYNVLAQYNGDIMIIYPSFFTELGGAVPTESFVIAENTVFKAVDSANGWAEIEGAETVTVTEALDVSCTDGVWGVTVPNADITVGFGSVASDGTWYLTTGSAEGTDTYYQMTATVDGAEQSIKLKRTDTGFTIWPNYFTAAPDSRLVIPANTVLTPISPDGGWHEITGGTTLTVTEALDVSCINGVWGITVPNVDLAVAFDYVNIDNTWYLTTNSTDGAKGYYKMTATVDGVDQTINIQRTDAGFTIWPNQFTSVPASSLVIPAGTVITSSTATITITNGLNVEYTAGTWLDMSQYADVTFTEITASDLSVFKTDDQAETNYRSVFGIKSLSENVVIENDADWHNFTKVAGTVLVDGTAVGAVFGMTPDSTGDSSWGADSALLLYITGEGYWDAATTASSVTICEGTILISGVDAAKGYKFTEDFVMYKNCDGSWDTTADTHVYSQQNTELEGALVSEANCKSAAVYCYSCTCGELGTETFTYGDLGDHDYVDGTCSVCGDTISVQNITLSLQTVAADGTWQLVPSTVPASKYYKIPVIIDGVACNVLAGESGGLMCIYPNFFTAQGGAVPAGSFVIPANSVLKAVDSENGWAEIENAASLVVTEELEISLVGGKWVEMSKYADVTFTEIHASDLDLYYQQIMRLEDYSSTEIALAKLQYPEVAELIETYGDTANMTTIGIKSNNSNVVIPNDANWASFTLLGTVSVAGASPVETYVLQTRDSSYTDSETAMDSAFLIRFYNGYVLDQATSITIEPGTRLVTADGKTGLVFVDGYTIYRNCQGTWIDSADIHSGEWTVSKEATYTQAGQKTRSCTACGNVETAQIPVLENPVTEWNITLGDNIGVNFVMTLAENDAVTVTVGGNAVESTVADGKLSVYVAAAQMTDEIVICVNGMPLASTYSVRGYADVILSGDYSEATKTLVKNMLAYGGAAQNYFGYNTSDLADADIEVTASVPTGDSEIEVSGGISGIAFYGATLVYETKIAVRIYFTADSIDGLTFTANGSTVSAETKNGLYYVEVSGIDPQKLGDDVEVVAANGTDSLSVSYSPMDYMVRMYEKKTSSDATKALVQALYGYYLAAVAYTA